MARRHTHAIPEGQRGALQLCGANVFFIYKNYRIDMLVMFRNPYMRTFTAQIAEIPPQQLERLVLVPS